MEEERPVCRVAHIKPSVENVVAYSRYKKTQPLIGGASMVSVPCLDVPILFGGGRAFELSLLQHTDNVVDGVDVFILSEAILLWFDHLGYGLEAPYSSVIYHGSVRSTTERDGHQLSMLLTLDRDPLLDQEFPTKSSPSVELLLHPRYSLYDRHYNAEIDTLFNFQDFGVNRGDQMVNNCNEAIATCLELFHDAQPLDDDNETDGTIG